MSYCPLVYPKIFQLNRRKPCKQTPTLPHQEHLQTSSDFHFQVSPVFPLSLAGGGPSLSVVGCAAVAVSPVCSKVEFATHSLIKAGLAKQIFLLGLL